MGALMVLGVHAGLVVMVHGDEGPVGDNTSDLDGTIGVLAGDQVLNGGGVEQLHIGELENLAEHGAGEESSMLNSDVAGVLASVLVRHTDLSQESISRLTHDHGREELATEPSTATRGDIGLDDSNLQIRTCLCQAIGGRETTASGTNNDNVTLGVLVKVVEVATGHLARDLALTDRPEGEVLPLASHLLDGGLGLHSTTDWHASGMRDSAHLCGDLGDLAIGGRLRVDSDGGHCVGRVV